MALGAAAGWSDFFGRVIPEIPIFEAVGVVVGEENGDEIRVDEVGISVGAGYQEEIAGKGKTLGRRYKQKQDGEVGKV